MVNELDQSDKKKWAKAPFFIDRTLYIVKGKLDYIFSGKDK